MKQLIRSAAVLFFVATLFSACTSVPDHARYIPADAVMVVGVNTKEMSKEIAWSAITGSKILDNLNKENEKDAAKQLDQAGINWMSTAYLYVKAADGLKSNTVIAGVLPLKNKGEWEAFVKKQFPQVTFKQVNGRTDASLDEKIYAGWNDHVLIVMNALPDMSKMNGMSGDYSDDIAAPTLEGDSAALVTHAAIIPPVVDMSATMDSAFAVTKERSILQDKRFDKLEKEGHDISMWVNYDLIMSRYMGNAMTKTMGLSLSNALWKGSAMASGLDFKKGKITTDMLYYSSEDLKEVSKEMGKDNADKEMIDRLPTQNMNMIMAWHLSPKGLKGTIEKAGLLGIVNLGLMSVGMSADDIFDTFTGDMAVSVANFTTTPANAGGMTESNTNVDFVYTLRIAKKENLAKLLSFAVSKEILKPAGNNMYQLAGESANTTVLANDDNYLVVTNKAESAVAYLKGKNKGGKLPQAAQKAIYGHPMGAYFDVTTVTKALIPPAGTSAADAALMEEAKKLLTDINFYGGSFNGSAFEYHATANFTNKEENGLLQLLDLAVKAKKAADEHKANRPAPVAADSASAAVNDTVGH